MSQAENKESQLEIIDKYTDNFLKTLLNIMAKNNVEQLNLAVENIKNNDIINTTLCEINNIKHKVLLQLQLSREKLDIFYKRLQKYRFILFNIKI